MTVPSFAGESGWFVIMSEEGEQDGAKSQ